MEETAPSFWKTTTGYASGKKCFSNGQKESSPFVTNENYKPNSAQLPNLCEELGVSCISYDDFMEIVSK